ncbi:MAG: carbon storage regulator CsrA [Cyanobacteria bacterium]|nr:carbon storage regulator CsrA [Cyanobacteriota bacterium]
MLVLTRKTGQKLIIANDIEVIILETKGDSVKIGINAPKSVLVYREEIYEEIKKANQQSFNQVKPSDLDEASQILGRYQFKTPEAKSPGTKKPPQK